MHENSYMVQASFSLFRLKQSTNYFILNCNKTVDKIQSSPVLQLLAEVFSQLEVGLVVHYQAFHFVHKPLLHSSSN